MWELQMDHGTCQTPLAPTDLQRSKASSTKDSRARYLQPGSHCGWENPLLSKPLPSSPLISHSSLPPSPPFLFLFLFPSSSFLPSSSPNPQVAASQVGGLVLAYGSRAGIRGGRALAAPESRVGFRVLNRRDIRKESPATFAVCGETS